MVYVFVVISAIALILLFKTQKRFAPAQYFIISDLFGENVVRKNVVIRFVIIFIHNILIIFVIDNLTSYDHSKSFIIFSDFLASLLIIWPIIYNPKKNLLVFPSKKTKLTLCLFYFLFVIFSMSIGWFSQYVYELYLHGKSLKSIWEKNILPNILISLVFTTLSGWRSVKVSKTLTNNFEEDRSNQNENFK